MTHKLDNARQHFIAACAASREWSKRVQLCFELYGDHGQQISGIARDHFPETVKNELRALARAVAVESVAACAARPKGTQMRTMRALSRAVAREHGSGFYGPQP